MRRVDQHAVEVVIRIRQRLGDAAHEMDVHTALDHVLARGAPTSARTARGRAIRVRARPCGRSAPLRRRGDFEDAADAPNEAPVSTGTLHQALHDEVIVEPPRPLLAQGSGSQAPWMSRSSAGSGHRISLSLAAG
jgi:hypothetical protein